MISFSENKVLGLVQKCAFASKKKMVKVLYSKYYSGKLIQVRNVMAARRLRPGEERGTASGSFFFNSR